MKSDARAWSSLLVGAAALTLGGVALSQWVITLTAIYTIFLIIDKLPVVIRRIREAYHWCKGESCK